MSAVLGIVSLSRRPIELAQFTRSLASLAHYGVDGHAQIVGDHFAFGVQRLNLSFRSNSALDPQKLGNLNAVSDAILNNRKEIEAKLCVSEASARDLLDNDLLLRAYAKWGEDCTRHIRGDYAFAIYDETAHRLFLTRDHIGTRPLYWAQRGGTVIFGSDIRALLAFKTFCWPLDELMVARHIMGPLRPLPSTFFKDINNLRPGSSLIIDLQGVRENRWWNPHEVPEVRYKKISDHVDHFRELMENVGAEYTATTGNIGSHVSGGMDSSSVAAFAQKALNKKGRTLTAGYTWSPPLSEAYPFLSKHDERHTLIQISRCLDLPINFGTADGKSQYQYLKWKFELNGIADLADELPVLGHAKNDGLKVMLSGWGGDEAYSAHGFGYLAFAIKHFQLREVTKLLQYYSGARRIRPRKAVKVLFTWGLVPMLPDGLYRRFAPFENLFEEGAFPSEKIFDLNPDPAPYVGEDVRLVSDPRRYLASLFLMGHLNMRMETWAAWSSHYGFQYRYPLLDRKLLEFVLGMPRKLFFGDGQSRYIARTAVKGMLPETLKKNDQANEALRNANHLACWRLLKADQEAGVFDGESAWISLPRLREAISRVPDQLNRSNHSDLAKILSAVRVFYMERRVT